MLRYTAKRLTERVETINEWLASDGSTIRFESGGRNGYEAVDEYSVDAAGNRVNSGCNRNVGCGTPRECAGYVEEAYNNEVSRMRRILSDVRKHLAGSAAPECDRYPSAAYIAA